MKMTKKAKNLEGENIYRAEFKGQKHIPTNNLPTLRLKFSFLLILHHLFFHIFLYLNYRLLK